MYFAKLVGYFVSFSTFGMTLVALGAAGYMGYIRLDSYIFYSTKYIVRILLIKNC